MVMETKNRNLITVSLDTIEGYINYIKQLEQELLSTNAYFRCHFCDKVFSEDVIKEHPVLQEYYCPDCKPDARKMAGDLFETAVSDEQDYQNAKRG